MNATAMPTQRRQVVPCESCGQPTPGLNADCDNVGCFTALIDLIVDEQQRRESDD